MTASGDGGGATAAAVGGTGEEPQLPHRLSNHIGYGSDFNLELAVTGHSDDDDGVTAYSIECALVRWESRLEWSTRVRLKRLRDELHDPVKKDLGLEVYAEHFGRTPFADKWGRRGTTARLDAWCRALAAAANDGVLRPHLLARVLRLLEAPSDSNIDVGSAFRFCVEAPLQEQFIFFIRHAESRWNAAKENVHFTAMYREHDHGVSEKGREQAERLRKTILRTNVADGDDWIGRFWNAGMIVTSPLTRAVQTAVISLRDVLAGGSGDLVCLRAAREKRELGGVDAMGVATGDNIREHVQQELAELYPEGTNWEEGGTTPAASPMQGGTPMRGGTPNFDGSETPTPSGRSSDGGTPTLGGTPTIRRKMRRTMTSVQRLAKRRSLLEAFDSINIDVSDVQNKWWDSVVETPSNFRDRIEEFVDQLRSSGEENVIVVGHSLFFRAMFRRLYCGQQDKSPGDLTRIANSLGHKTLPNCGVVGLRVSWQDENGPAIKEVIPMFGTELP